MCIRFALYTNRQSADLLIRNYTGVRWQAVPDEPDETDDEPTALLETDDNDELWDLDQPE